MRIQRILVGAALLMLCAAAAYAQVTVSSTPVTTVISTGRAEAAGSLRLSASATGALADTITVRFGGLSITNQLSNTNIDTAGGWVCTYVSQNNLGGIVTISCPDGATANQYFQLNGVRLNIDGYAGANVVATIGTLVNPIIAGQNTATVINSIAPGLVAAATGQTAVYLANQHEITAPALWDLTEGFAAAWKTTDQAGTPAANATNGTQITITVTGLAANMLLNVSAGGSGSLSPVIVSGAQLSSTVTQTVLSFSATDQSLVETLSLTFNPAFTNNTLLPVQSWYAYATLSPEQAALTSTGGIVASPKYPKFAKVNLPTAGFTVLTVNANSTNFIIPYLTTELGYNTGIALANTTLDPFGDFGAIPQDGAVVVTFYPNDGTAAITYDSAVDGAVGKGMPTGVLKAGSTWTVLASEIFTKKGKPAGFAFSGYAVVVLKATNGHGVSYVSNFGGFTSASPMLVLFNPTIWERSDPFLGTERLTQ